MIHSPSDTNETRERLVALRDRLTAEIETAPAAYLAPLARQLQAVLVALADMPSNNATSTIARLDASRKAKLIAAGIPEVPRRGR